MAFLAQDDKQNQDQNQQNQQQGGAAGQSLAGGGASGGSFVSGTPVSTAGVGSGGTGGWTNIQSYLNANAGQTGSAEYMKSKVGSAFDTEKQNATQQSDQAKQAGQKQVEQNNLGQDRASQMIQEASKNYNYSGGQGDAYNQNVNSLRGYLGNTYQGPKQFGYALSGRTQQYGSDLGNDQGFQGMMNGFYNEAAGGKMGSGALALQQQLDTNNEAVQNARKSMLDRYSGLTSDINTLNQNTNAALQGYQDAYGKNQSALRDYLTAQAQTNYGQVDQAAKDWNSAEQGARDTAWNAGPHGEHTNHYFQVHSNRDNGAKDLVFADVTANADNFYRMNPAGSAELSNVGGVDTQRNVYNTIHDVLGDGSKIGYQGPIQHGTYGFDQAAYDAALRAGHENWDVWDGVHRPSVPGASNTFYF